MGRPAAASGRVGVISGGFRWRPLSLLIGCLFLCGCSPAYVLRAGYEEARILWRRQPIERLLADPKQSAATKAKLELVLDVRRFAAEVLELNAGGSYTTVSEVDDDQVVHVVSAAPRFELRAHTWWFPIVGSVPYKGYFDKEAAVAEARSFEEQGLDTYIRPALAFSTLGWFDDPLLSSLLRYDVDTLTELIIHELLHNTTYLAGRGEFDESFATFVGYRGAAAYFAARGDAEAKTRVEAAWRDAVRFSDFLATFMRELREAYARGITFDERALLFERGQQEFRRLGLDAGIHRGFVLRPLNNAVILQHAMYAQRLRLFDELAALEPDLARLIRSVVDAIHADRGDPFAVVERLKKTVPLARAFPDCRDATGG